MNQGRLSRKTIVATFFLMALAACGAAYAQNVGSAPFTISLGPQQALGTKCDVEVSVADIGKKTLTAQSPNWTVSFTLPQELNINRKVIVQGQSSAIGQLFSQITQSGNPGCRMNGEIYLNEIIMNEWKAISTELAKTTNFSYFGAEGCIRVGAMKLGEQVEGALDSPSLFLRAYSEKGQRLLHGCQKLGALPSPKKNIGCTLNAGRIESRCDEQYYAINAPGRPLTYAQAEEAAADGTEVKIGLWETQVASQERQAREQAEREREAAARAHAAEEIAKREARQRWLETADGKKFLAEEESRRKRAEDERAKQMAAKKAEDEKRSRVCRQMRNWASDSRELIAASEKVSMYSISLVRFELSESNNCLAVVDTAKGPTRCLVWNILQDKNSGEYFAAMGVFGAKQAVCGTWASR